MLAEVPVRLRVPYKVRVLVGGHLDLSAVVFALHVPRAAEWHPVVPKVAVEPVLVALEGACTCRAVRVRDSESKEVCRHSRVRRENHESRVEDIGLARWDRRQQGFQRHVHQLIGKAAQVHIRVDVQQPIVLGEAPNGELEEMGVACAGPIVQYLAFPSLGASIFTARSK